MRAWQSEAVSAWRSNDRRGIVVAATGTGKSRVGLEALDDILELGGIVVIVVPTKALQDQWFGQLRYDLKMGPAILGRIGGSQADFNLTHRVVLAVLDSARVKLPQLLDYWRAEGEDVLLLIDECHRLGSSEARSLLRSPFTSSLGLSATPQLADGNFEPQIEGSLGPVVYELPLRRALDDGLLAPLRLLDLYFYLGPAELHEYKATQSQIGPLKSSLAHDYPELNSSGGFLQSLASLASIDERASRLLGLINQNRRLVANSKERRRIFGNLVGSGLLDGRRTIVFNETIDQAEASMNIATAHGIKAVMDHSKVPNATRTRAIQQFKTGVASALIAVRTVDEGIDVPEASLAIINSGTLTKRQRVQRIGRVVRPSGGTTASVISLLAAETTEEYLVGMDDPELVGPGRVRSHTDIPGPEEIAWLLGHETPLG